MRRPPDEVIAAFGVRGTPEHLGGGTGRSWRVGGLVLKPLDRAPAEVAWQAELFAAVETDRFRVARPLPEVVDGWTATTYEPGRHEAGRWREIIAVGERFHAALEDIPRPDALLDARTDPWSVGDRVAWGELTHPAVADLAEKLEPVAAPAQLIHGDLTGNVLFHEELPPAILDFSPYFRPAPFASAIVVADAICWESAPFDLAHAVDRQHLLRALIYRAVTSMELGRDGERELALARRIAGR